MNEPTSQLPMVAVPVEQTPMAMLGRAVESGCSIEVLERLVSLSERWQATNARRAFTGALSALRNELPEIVKNRKVDFTTSKGRTNYKYEDLADMVEALSPPMAKHGLSFRWRTDSTTQGLVRVTCIVEHRDGHNEETTLAGPYDESGNKNAIQAIGSVVTYLQRYTLKAALGIAAAHDDDGRQGAPPGAPPKRTTPAPTKPPAKAAPVPKAKAAPPPEATEKTRQWMLSALAHRWTEEELVGWATDAGILFPGEELETWPLNKVPTSKAALSALVQRIDRAMVGEPPDPAASGPGAYNPALEDDRSEPWWDVIIPVPPAGMKRDEYLKDPDTIRSLYHRMKGGDQDAQRRLWGFTKWEPKGWEKKDGTRVPPSEQDLAAREALDKFVEYEESKKEEGEN